MATLKPYANEADVLRIGGLTVENRTDRVSLYGNLDLTRDRAGLADARRLQTLVNDVVRALEAEPLPERVESKPEERVENPFK